MVEQKFTSTQLLLLSVESHQSTAHSIKKKIAVTKGCSPEPEGKHQAGGILETAFADTMLWLGNQGYMRLSDKA